MQTSRNMTMPLLGKELVEQAARKRTYIIRVVYAVLLFAASAFLLHDMLRVYGFYGYGMHMLGLGRQIAEPLVFFQFFGICLFLPAMLSGTIAVEKERDSLALLFLTDMGPWEILLQKYLGRLIPMFSFLLLSLPVMAVAYALGGIESRFVIHAAWMLLLACLQVGALALLCSVIFRTAVGAFMAAYLGLAALYLLPVLLSIVWREAGLWNSDAEGFWFCLLPPYIYAEHQRNFWELLLYSLPIQFSVLLFLLLARWLLVRRAFAPPRNPLLNFFRQLDRMFKRWNDRVGGYTLGRTQDRAPEDDPVAWRELHKRSMGRLSYLVRLGLCIEIPVLAVGCASILGSGVGFSTDLLLLTYGVVWALVALFVTVQGANTIVAERTQQTLEVLLTTPISGDEIVRQKMRAMYRLCMLFAIPLLTVAAMGSYQFEIQNGFTVYGDAGRPLRIYAVSTVLCVLIYPPLLAWFSMWIGLRVRTRARAILTALIALVVWCLAAPVALFILTEVCRVMPLNSREFFPQCLLLFSPACGVFLTAAGWSNEVFRSCSWLALLFNFVLYAVLLFWLRYLCLRNADRLLRRM